MNSLLICCYALFIIVIFQLPFLVNAVIYTFGGAEGDEFNVATCNEPPFVQSPIDIPLTARHARYRPLVFNNHRNIFPGVVMNTRLSLIVTLTHGNQLTVSGGGLPDISPNFYTFDRLEFHWPSEHTIGGHSYGLEAELIYISSAQPDLDTALTVPNGVVIISVLFHVSEQSNDVIGNILNSARSAFDTVPPFTVTTDPLLAEIRLTDILPESICSYFRYVGTRTLPPCAPNIVWTIFLDSRKVSQTQVDRFRMLPSDETTDPRNILPFNSRPTKQRGSRVVTFRSSLSCRTIGASNLNTIPWLLRPFLFFNRL